MESLKGQLVLLTGGKGFLGRHIHKELLSRKCYVETVGHIGKPYDLIEFSSVRELFYDCKDKYGSYPKYIINCAGFNGGIKFNIDYPADIARYNVLMGCNIMQTAKLFLTEKVLNILTSCAYPDVGYEILEEENFYNGKCNETISAHGMAKRYLHVLSKAYYKQYDLKSVCCIVTNLYGEFDSYDVNRTKVVGALIKKFVDAKENNYPKVECWGTGNPLREFMYAGDAAKAIVKTLEVYDNYETPLNIGTGSDVTIKYLAETIAEIVGYKGEIFWDVSKGDGQMKKLLSVKRMKEYLGDIPITDLRTGLEKTIKWYMELYNAGMML